MSSLQVVSEEELGAMKQGTVELINVAFTRFDTHAHAAVALLSAAVIAGFTTDISLETMQAALASCHAACVSEEIARVGS